MFSVERCEPALFFLDFLLLAWLLLRPDFFFVGIRQSPFCRKILQEARHGGLQQFGNHAFIPIQLKVAVESIVAALVRRR
jgi:hypothetical protein